jgi:flagellar hook-length control protein FliK
MQTQSIQLNQLNNREPAPKNAAPANDEFKQALSREMDRAPVCSAPEAAPAPAAKTSQPAKQVAKPAQQAKPAQNQQAQQADDAAAPADTQAQAADTATTAEAPAATARPADAEPVQDEATAAAAADPMASMLAMLAAYNHLNTEKAAPAEERPAAATDAAALAALQTDAGGKRAAVDPAATSLAPDTHAPKAKPDGTSTLQQALTEKTDAERLAKLADSKDGIKLTADQKTEAFAARLADAAPAPQPVLPQAAQALAATVQAADIVATNQLQARVGSNVWEQQLGQKVVWMVAGGDQSASLTLNPPDLGPMQVVLNVSNDSASATFTAHQPETRQAIENALPKLREMMSEAGIQLGNATVSAGTQDQQQAFAEQARRAGSNGGGRGYGDGAEAGQPDTPQPVIRRSVLGAVDTFA